MIRMSIELYHGDCLEVMKGLPDMSVDCFICDLPYGCLTVQNGKKKISEKLAKNYHGKVNKGLSGCSWDIKINLDAFWTQVKRLAKSDNSPVIHFCTTKFGAELIASNPSWFRYDLVWNKQRGVSFLTANKMPMRSHEMIYVFSKAGAYYNRVDYDRPGKKQYKQSTTQRSDNVYSNNKLTRSTGAPENKECVKSVIDMKKVGTHKQSHPTEKPIELYKWLIERYCPEGGTILDPTAGSGNVGFAGYELDRNVILIEKDDVFHEKISEKLDTLSI